MKPKRVAPRAAYSRIVAATAALGLHVIMDGLIQNWLLDPQAFDLEKCGRQTMDAYLTGLEQARDADLLGLGHRGPGGSPARCSARSGSGACCTHRLRGKVRPCYNTIEVNGNEVRVLLKEPYVDATVVADFHDVNRRYCRWREGTEPIEHGIEPAEEN